jgi:uncharacterized protein (DUF433 family)
MSEYKIVMNSGCPRIEGSRIGVYDVMDYWPDKGYSIEQIAEMFRLVPDQIRVAIRYIEEHREEVEATYRQILERDARGNSPEVEAKILANRPKVRALWEEIRRKHQERNGAV